MRGLLHRLICTAFAATAAAATASAQNYDAHHQVRSGVFAQWGIIRGDNQLPASVDHYAFSTLAVGFTAGIEQVRRDSWSYGIEVDGGVHSGETKNGTAQYGANYSASVRLRAGRHIRDDVLWYGTLGIGALGAEIRVPGLLQTSKVFGTKAGFIIGTGIERDFGPGVWFAEYLFADYRSLGIAAQSIHFDSAAHMLRAGIKFKLGHDHYHDDVADRIGRRLERRD